MLGFHSSDHHYDFFIPIKWDGDIRCHTSLRETDRVLNEASKSVATLISIQIYIKGNLLACILFSDQKDLRNLSRSKKNKN